MLFHNNKTTCYRTVVKPQCRTKVLRFRKGTTQLKIIPQVIFDLRLTERGPLIMKRTLD